MNKIRAKAGSAPTGTGHDEPVKLRINVQMVGNTLIMARHEQESRPAGGVGLAFRRMCVKPPPLSMMRGEKLDDDVTEGSFMLVNGVKFGTSKILLVDEVDAARYPSDETLIDSQQIDVPDDVKANVIEGGFLVSKSILGIMEGGGNI